MRAILTGDPVGNSFSTVATAANFPEQHFANFYHGYLENAMNNYLLDLNQPHGYPQHVNRWHSAGIGGGTATCTDGKSIWSEAAAFGHFLYRGVAGSEDVGVWGSSNFSNFYTFPGVVPIPKGNTVLKMEATPGAQPGSAVIYTLVSGNDSALWAMDGYDPTAKLLWHRGLPLITANTTVTSFAIRNSVLYTLTSDGIVTRVSAGPATSTLLSTLFWTISHFELGHFEFSRFARIFSAQCHPTRAVPPHACMPAV